MDVLRSTSNYISNKFNIGKNMESKTFMSYKLHAILLQNIFNCINSTLRKRG
uniref:Uncharacterized protein n=1 Tax=Rhizophora mucronata TaxID=61149 RepID=A0A2P2P5S4_RHIMU